MALVDLLPEGDPRRASLNSIMQGVNGRVDAINHHTEVLRNILNGDEKWSSGNVEGDLLRVKVHIQKMQSEAVGILTDCRQSLDYLKRGFLEDFVDLY